MSKIGGELIDALERIRKVDSRVPFSISEIPSFPFANFKDMQEAIRSGSCGIVKFSFHPDPHILGLVSPNRKVLYQVLSLAMFVVPVISIVLAFAVSHWFWFGLLYFIVGARLVTRVWKNSILRAAHKSESAFCLLFYTSKINAYDLETSTEYEWQQLKEDILRKEEESLREETPFEKQFKSHQLHAASLLLDRPSSVFPLLSRIFDFPARKYFEESEEIDTIYFELSFFCLFCHDFAAVKTEPQNRRDYFESNCCTLYLIWKNELSEEEFYSIINDRMQFYGESASRSGGYRFEAIGQNLYKSGKGGLVDQWTLEPNPKFEGSEPLHVAADWGKWASATMEEAEAMLS